MDVVALTDKHLVVHMKSGLQFSGRVCEVQPPGYPKKAFEESQDAGNLWIQDGPRTIQVDASEIAAVSQW